MNDHVRDAIYKILKPLKDRDNISGHEAERIEDDVAESILSEMRLDRRTHLNSDDLSAIQRRVISKVDHRLHRGSGVHQQTNVQRDEPRHERDAPRRDRDEPRWDRDVPRRERDVPQTTSGPTPRDSGAGGGFAREQLEPGSQGSEMSDREMARGFGKGGGSYGGGGGSSYGKGGGEYDGKGGGKQYGTGGFGRSMGYGPPPPPPPRCGYEDFAGGGGKGNNFTTAECGQLELVLDLDHTCVHASEVRDDARVADDVHTFTLSNGLGQPMRYKLRTRDGLEAFLREVHWTLTTKCYLDGRLLMTPAHHT